MDDMITTVQQQLGYYFKDQSRLHACFRAAHRSDLDEVVEDDGNRALALFGVSIMTMVEHSCSITIEREARHIASQRASWVSSKDKRAEACDRLGFSPFIQCSVRQGNSPPAKPVRAAVISAIVAAVYQDLEARGMALGDAVEQLAEVLGRMGTRARGDLPVDPASLYRNPAGQARGSDLRAARDNLQTHNGPLLSSAPEHDAQEQAIEVGTSPGQPSELYSDVPMTSSSDSEPHPIDLGWDQVWPMTDEAPSLDAAAQDLSDLSETSMLGFSDDSWMVLDADPDHGVFASDDTTSLAAVKSSSSSKPPRKRCKFSDENETQRKHYIQAEMSKVLPGSTADMLQQTSFLENSSIAKCVDPQHVSSVEVLYYFIGSTQSVVAFKHALQDLRGRERTFFWPHENAMSMVDHLHAIEDLHQATAANSLLTRWHILKAFEADLPQAAGTFVPQLPSAFDPAQQHKPGNRRLKATSEAVNSKMSARYPELAPGTPEYRKQRRYLVQLFQTAKQLYAFTERLGMPILAFMPYQDQSGIYFSDKMFLGIPVKDLKTCVDLLMAHQGAYLTELSRRTQVIANALLDKSFWTKDPFPLELCSDDQVGRLSKGSNELLNCL